MYVVVHNITRLICFIGDFPETSLTDWDWVSNYCTSTCTWQSLIIIIVLCQGYIKEVCIMDVNLYLGGKKDLYS